MPDEEERELVMKAINNARKAIEETFEDAGVEQGFFEFNITCYILSSDFEDVLGIIEDKEWVDNDVKRKEVE